ncbi:MAG: chemotaxis protein CheW [Candidatus Competibacteraceae bacterium]|nr:chemotaxis protein CheW [Candidatus Competibacteraceae bacterium]
MQSLRSFLISFRGGQGILPGSSMIEVLPFANPLTIDAAPGWVVGAMLWRAFNVPLVDLGGLIYGADPDMEAHSRIVMVNALSGHQALPYLGLLGTDAPRLLNLDRSQITTGETPLEMLEKDEPNKGVLGWAVINRKLTIVPDLPAIGTTLVPLIQHS